MNAPERALRIFLSSTAQDLAAYREKVSDTILRLQHLPVAMETFPATPGAPADDSRAHVASADAVVVLVAHRYGFVPPPELGGDGQRSITWLEVEAARQAGKPVFAFLLDADAPWDQPREQDRLKDRSEDPMEVAACVRRLEDFRAWLAENCTCNSFVTADDLAVRVATALSFFVQSGGAAPAPRKTPWRPLVMHALQPARHFHGRAPLVRELREWVQAPRSAEHVVSLVAAGGTGKTALAQRVLARAAAPAGLLVWSFYDDPHTEEFLRVACEYFSGVADTPVGGRLERLQLALAGDEPHLLMLDGLERVQATGHDGQPRGALRDPQIKRLLRFISLDACRARALVTSRYPVVDLEEWDGAGHRTVRLDDLDAPAARAVLRGWGVLGGKAALDTLAEEVHRHALTLAVLGSYLGNFCNGDPAAAPTFDRAEAAGMDPKALRLARVLGEYADALDPAERALLGRLAAFTRGVDVTVITYLLDAGGRVAGALAGLDEARVRQLLVRLRDLGLVFGYRVGKGVSYTAHPFLREYFDSLRDVPSREIHEVVRQRLAPRLVVRPNQLPVDAAMLDAFETVIEHTRLAGKVQEALDLYWDGLGGYNHLGKWLGDNARGLRIVTGFSEDGTLAGAAAGLPDRERAALLDNWGLYAKNLGELQTARQAFDLALALWRRNEDAVNCSAILQNIADTELLAGRFVAARDAALHALEHADAAADTAQQTQAHAYVAMTRALLGDVERAGIHFREAGRFQARGIELLRRFQTAWSEPQVPTYRRDDLLYSVPGLLEAEFKLICGRRDEAELQLQVTRARSQHERSERTRAICDTLLGRVSLADNPRAAGEYLQAARAFNEHAGVVEIKIRAHLLGADLQWQLGSLDAARREAEEGLQAADGCGFGRYSIELRLALARIALACGDPRQALACAREVLELATGPECRYAWGEGDALDLAARAHQALGEHEMARRRFSAAASLRARLGHPGLPDTRAALAELAT